MSLNGGGDKCCAVRKPLDCATGNVVYLGLDRSVKRLINEKNRFSFPKRALQMAQKNDVHFG